MGCVVFGNVVIMVLTLASYVMQMTALNSKNWIRNSARMCGLFKCCEFGHTCGVTEDYDWLSWTRALLIINICLLLFSSVFLWMLGMKWQRNFSCGFAALILTFLSAAMSTAAMVLYTKYAGVLMRSYEYGYGFVVVWSCTGANWLIGFLQILILHQMRKLSKNYQVF